jgi:hypothetical protein
VLTGCARIAVWIHHHLPTIRRCVFEANTAAEGFGEAAIRP